ncbi:MAG: phosphatidate cytidylyltransferase [Chloroflexi bacterium]|nr:phosphatidate cytidylyltransferase [Chloroflexota bacterium]
MSAAETLPRSILALPPGGIVYIGWIGAYLLDIRNLPEGGWWFMLVLPSVWLADSGAYSIGRAYGKHKMAPRLSPGRVGKATLQASSPA